MPISVDVIDIADPTGQDADTAQATIEAQGATVVRIEQVSDEADIGKVLSYTVENTAITAATDGTARPLVTLYVGIADTGRARLLRRSSRIRRGRIRRASTILQQRVQGFDV